MEFLKKEMKIHTLQDMDILCTIQESNMIYYLLVGKIITIDSENNFDSVNNEIKRIKKLKNEGKRLKI